MSAAYQRVVEALGSRVTKASDGSAVATCPAHDDKNASLSVRIGREGRALVKCHAGCTAGDVVQAVGLTLADLMPSDNGASSRKTKTKGRGAAAAGTGCTLTAYATAKKLDARKLAEWGVTQATYCRAPAVRVVYRDAAGQERAVRYRIAVDGSDKFRWSKGSKTMLYGLDQLERARAAGHAVLVEGESDCHTCWTHDVPALGVPGAGTWRREWRAHLDRIERVYVVQEPGDAGEKMVRAVAADLGDRLYVVAMPADPKDPSADYCADPAGFPARWAARLAAAEKWTDRVAAEARARANTAWVTCEALAEDCDILARVDQLAEALGVVGEHRLVRLTYLVVTSRLLPRPCSQAIKGPSAAGKSWVIEQVLRAFPPSAYYALSSMSERALAYSTEPLSHRMLVLFEAAGLASDFASYLLRSLLSEGKVRYETVERGEDGKFAARLIERAGPTGVILTTTAVRLHPENETRIISMVADDTPEQTKAVFRQLAAPPTSEPDLTTWHALQEWLAASALTVAPAPFAPRLAALVPPVAVRLRRDFGQVLRLVEAHALLHAATRGRDPEGRVVPTVADYAAVRDLVADLVTEGVEATVSKEVRETVAAVETLTSTGATTSISRVAVELKLDRSAVSRRIARAIDAGYLDNDEDHKGKPARLRIGDPMPDDVEILPRPEALA